MHLKATLALGLATVIIMIITDISHHNLYSDCKCNNAKLGIEFEENRLRIMVKLISANITGHIILPTLMKRILGTKLL